MFGFECELTRHSGECRPGRTVPLVPSTSQADDPATTEPIQCTTVLTDSGPAAGSYSSAKGFDKHAVYTAT